MTWFGETAADRRRTLGLVAVTTVLAPLIAVAELLFALGVPCGGRR